MPIFMISILYMNNYLNLDILEVIFACFGLTVIILIFKGLLSFLYKGVVFFRVLAVTICLIITVISFYFSFDSFEKDEPPSW